MQAHKLKDELKKIGIGVDLVDLEALIDSSLTYPENYRNIVKRYKRVDSKATKTKTKKGGASNLDIHYASQSHQARSPQARTADEARTSCKTFTEKQVLKDASLLDRWYAAQNRLDLEAIDTGHSTACSKKPKTKSKSKTKTKRKKIVKTRFLKSN